MGVNKTEGQEQIIGIRLESPDIQQLADGTTSMHSSETPASVAKPADGFNKVAQHYPVQPNIRVVHVNNQREEKDSDKGI